MHCNARQVRAGSLRERQPATPEVQVRTPPNVRFSRCKDSPQVSCLGWSRRSYSKSYLTRTLLPISLDKRDTHKSPTADSFLLKKRQTASRRQTNGCCESGLDGWHLG